MDKDILSKITQGKWEAVKNGDRSYVKSETADEVVCNCFTEANAQFIAHTPETLKQRDDLLSICTDLCVLVQKHAPRGYSDDVLARAMQVIKQAEEV